MTIPRLAKLRFLFNGGRGITPDQIDWNERDAHLDAKISSIMAPTTPLHIVMDAQWREGQSRIHLSDLALPSPSLLFVTVPAAISRASSHVTIRSAGVEDHIRTTTGDMVKARELTPGHILGMMRLDSEFRLTEALPPRPQDYRFRVIASENELLDLAELPTGSESPLDGSRTPWPTNLTEANFPSSAYIFVGRPADAPPIAGIHLGRSNQLGGFGNEVTMDDHEGVSYVWLRSNQRLSPRLSSFPLDLLHGEYED